jgi:hypothetical protein
MHHLMLEIGPLLSGHDLFGKPLHTFPDHALVSGMIFSENRCTLFRIMP